MIKGKVEQMQQDRLDMVDMCDDCADRPDDDDTVLTTHRLYDMLGNPLIFCKVCGDRVELIIND